MLGQFIRSVRINSDQLEASAYYTRIPALKNVTSLDFHNPITFFVGENGSGKSTLLEAIALAYGFPGEGGSLNFSFSTKDTHSSLYEGVTLVRGYHKPTDGFFLRAESFYNVATQVDQLADSPNDRFLKNYGGSLHTQSHGESFLSLLLYRFRGEGLYLLDEPEAALSPQRQLTLLLGIHKLASAGSQFIVASHSPILLGMPGADLYEFGEDGISSICYEETESYQITKLFMEHREQLLAQLLEEE